MIFFSFPSEDNRVCRTGSSLCHAVSVWQFRTGVWGDLAGANKLLLHRFRLPQAPPSLSLFLSLPVPNRSALVMANGKVMAA